MNLKNRKFCDLCLDEVIDVTGVQIPVYSMGDSKWVLTTWVSDQKYKRSDLLETFVEFHKWLKDCQEALDNLQLFIEEGNK